MNLPKIFNKPCRKDKSCLSLKLLHRSNESNQTNNPQIQLIYWTELMTLQWSPSLGASCGS